MEGASADAENGGSSSDEDGEHMWTMSCCRSFAHRTCSPFLQGFVHEEELCTLLVGCVIPLSGLSAVLSVGFLSWLVVSFVHCCGVCWTLLPSWKGCIRMERVVMGDDKCRYRDDTTS